MGDSTDGNLGQLPDHVQQPMATDYDREMQLPQIIREMEPWKRLREHMQNQVPEIQRDFWKVVETFIRIDPFAIRLEQYLLLKHNGAIVSPQGNGTQMPFGGSASAPTFTLTSSESRAIAEAFANDGHKLSQFKQLLNLPKDAMPQESSELSPYQYVEAVLTHYQSQPESSKEKLVTALEKVGLTQAAEMISLSRSSATPSTTMSLRQ